MDIQRAGNVTTEQTWGTVHQRPAENPRQEAQEATAQGTKIPDGAQRGTQEGAVASARNETQQQARQDAAALKQASASGAEATQTTTTTEDDSEYQAIVQKADNGQTLTSAELSQLRAKDPARYSKAVKAAEARQNLRSQMESDPSHASKVAREAIAAVKAESADAISGAHGAAEGTAAIVSALNDEYSSFARQYDQVMFESGAIPGEE